MLLKVKDTIIETIKNNDINCRTGEDSETGNKNKSAKGAIRSASS